MAGPGEPVWRSPVMVSASFRGGGLEVTEEPEDPFTSPKDVLCTMCGQLWHKEQVEVIATLTNPDPVSGATSFGLCAGCLGDGMQEPRCPTCHRPFAPSA